ncbi:MAG: glycosyltransferase family 39 protein [Candidatus Omnitrophota bacterium]
MDEGIDSIKSLLHLNGFRLYKEIWSDQPPLFTVILSFWYKIFGASFYYGRILVLFFCAFLILAFYLAIKNLHGRIGAFAGCLFLMMSLSYLRLSVSIMLGLPALALAMASIYYGALYAKSKLKYPLILSGIFMALSLQTKFFTVPLIPIIALGIGRARKLWLAVVFLTYLTITIIFFYPDFHLLIPQLVKPHFTLLNSSNQHLPVIYAMLLQDYDIALLALCGIILSIKKRGWGFLMPFSWLLLNSAMLLIYKPVWYHYYPLISIPICWLAAISVSSFFSLRASQCWLPKKNTSDIWDVLLRWLTAILLILSITLLPSKYHRMRNSLQGETSIQESQILKLLLKYKPNTRWIFSDIPTFAFSTGMLIPPEIAVTTVKRKFTNEDAGDYFVNILQKYKPEQILISSSYGYSPRIISFIRENYIKIYDDYVLKPPDYPYPNRDLEISWLKEPIGKLLPKKIQFTSNKRLYSLLWHSILIPLPQRKEIAVTIHKTRVEIFVRKDILKLPEKLTLNQLLEAEGSALE